MRGVAFDPLKTVNKKNVVVFVLVFNQPYKRKTDKRLIDLDSSCGV